jgi:uncharacterized protein YhaN
MMRLLNIEVENFGMFRETSVSLGDGRFHLVCGPNEAGKSTLLQLMRELLFGFPIRNPYAFAEHDGEMAATALAEMRDGARITFRRRKGTKNTVTGQVEGTGRQFNESGLIGLLGNASAEMYQNVFGFSLAELASGEASLKNSRLEEALYGGGLGGLANFQRSLAAIQAEHHSLFAPKAHKGRTINKLLADIHEESAKLVHAMVKPRDYKELCQRRDECTDAAEALRKRRDERFRRQSHIERLKQALPLWQRLMQANEELASLDVPATFPLAAAEEFRQTRQQLWQLGEEVKTAEGELAEINADLARIHLEPELIAKEPAIKQCVQQLAQIASCRRDIPLRRHEVEMARTELVATLSELHPDWGLSHLEQFRTSLDQRDRVKRMETESASLEKRAEKVLLQYADKQAKLAKDSQELARLQAIPAIPQLEKLIQHAGQYRADCEQIEQISSQLVTLDDQINHLRKKIAGPFGIPAEQVESLPVPLAASVQEFGEQYAAAIETLRQATNDHKQARHDLSRRQEELTHFDATQRVPDRQALKAQRDYRDDGWRLIRQRYLEGQHLGSQVDQWLGDESASLPDRYEQEVRKADGLADDCQEKAELVARREQIAADVARYQSRAAETHGELRICQAARDRLDASWREAWRTCGLSPKSPDVMADWLRLHAQLSEKLENRLEVDRRLRQLQKRVSAFQQSLGSAVGEEGDTDDLLSLAQKRVQDARDAASQIFRLNHEIPTQKEELQRLGEDQEELSRQRKTWDRRWKDLLTELGFPTEWDVHLAVTMLSELANARIKYHSVGATEKRIHEMTDAVTAFEQQVATLCGSVGSDLQTLPAEEAASQLNDRLADAKQAAKQHTTLLDQHKRTKRRLESRQAQCAGLRDRLDTLRMDAGVASDDEFERMAASAEKRKVLGDEIDRLHRDFSQIAANENRSQFEAELAAADTDSLVLALQEAEQELFSLEEQYTQAVEQAALAKRNVEEIEQRQQVNELSQTLESNRAELRDAVARWAPLVLAESMLTQAIARFERENQPDMLRDVGLFFAKLTSGRYTGLRKKLDENRSLVLSQANGKDKGPHQLSTGTREQLYLAIRLAYAQHYCRDNEPLPIIMDDVLVNFDDQRRDAALECLIELSQDIQIIFLTCHQDTTQWIKSRLTEMQPTRLGCGMTNESRKQRSP